MKIRVYSAVENGIFKITITTEAWSEGDQRLIADYGEPQIDLGGTIDGPAPDYVTFTLPNDFVNIMSDSPFQQGFDSRDTSASTAQEQAIAWKLATVDNIETAITVMRETADTFTNEEVTVV